MKWAALLALALAALCSPAAAATLYISEFSNGITPVNSSQPQVPPTPSLADQTVALSGASASSSAFGSATHVVSLICDEGCSVQFGTAPTATTSTLLLQQGVTYLFGVVPGGKVAAIANAAGNSAAGGTVTANQGTAGTNAQAWWVQIGDTTNGPAAVKAASTAPTATDKALTVALSPNGLNANGPATPANSAPVTVANPTTITTGQVAPTGSAATLLASRALRLSVTFCNIGSVNTFIGPATVTTANGLLIVPGACYTSSATALFQAITSSGTGSISYIEEY